MGKYIELNQTNMEETIKEGVVKRSAKLGS